MKWITWITKKIDNVNVEYGFLHFKSIKTIIVTIQIVPLIVFSPSYHVSPKYLYVTGFFRIAKLGMLGR